MIDFALSIAFRLTGSRAISEKISERRVDAKWKAMERAAIARGATIVTHANKAGSSSYILEA